MLVCICDSNDKCWFNNIKAASLKRITETLIEAKNNGSLITHATDSISTIRKNVGSFSASGIHVDKDMCLLQ